MSRPLNKGDFSEESGEVQANQDEEDVFYKAKTFWPGQGDNDLSVHPNDLLEPKVPNLPKPGYIYAINQRTGAQGFVPKSLVKKDPSTTHTARVAEAGFYDDRSNAGGERRVRFQSPLKASPEDAAKIIAANRDSESVRTMQPENRNESKEDRLEDKNSTYAKLNEIHHKNEYLNLFNTSSKNPNPKSGMMSRVEHSPYVDISKSHIPRGLPSFSKFKLPSSSHSREQSSEYVEHCPSKFTTDPSHLFKSKPMADPKLYPTTHSSGTTSSSQNKPLPNRSSSVQQLGIPITNSEVNSYAPYSVPNYYAAEPYQTHEKLKLPVGAAGSMNSSTINEHQLSPVYFVTPILCRHCNDYIWGSGKVGHRCEKTVM